VGWSVVPCKLGQCVEPSTKLLAIEEDVASINDGQWCAASMEDGLSYVTSLSVIHDKGREYGGGNRVDPNVYPARPWQRRLRRRTLRLRPPGGALGPGRHPAKIGTAWSY
jgi:hypothetical protein